ncbi:peptidase domain-containing protein [Methanomicrobium antiquum]|uniref:Peptidase domain-containing protein n=1 Tax=Methanomicrobium antiquum TaxID=487686 RepID=A0AAF0FLW2_9EURY|nr:peptidase domain-containing protein [Methanomicrobium antiquum]WFN36270.1 peptidase domain-containing protein [Methanomicrobium antiquum]
MLKKIAITLLVLFCCVSFVSGAAGEEEAGTDLTKKFDGYTILPAKDSGGEPGMKYVFDTITQGETNWHSKYVSSDITVLNVDLNWGDYTDSLRLKIYTPDWQCLGSYYDSADGSIDGRINLDISNPGGIAKGTWYYEVYGNDVSGTEDYYI